MTIISKEKVKDMYYANLTYEYHRASEKIRLFEEKYGMSFGKFEKGLKGSEEDIEKWDDYMEWKGKVLQRLTKEKIEDKIAFGGAGRLKDQVRNADIQRTDGRYNELYG